MSITLDRPSADRVSAKRGAGAGTRPPKRSTRPKGGKVRRWLRRFFMIASAGLFILIVAAVAFVAWAWNTLELPPEKPLAQTTFITDANGNRLATLAGENRVTVPLTSVPMVVRQAVLDTEDHNYFEHRGVDPRGISRALYNDVTNGSSLQGGSTITQQYVKKTYVGDQRTAVRKFKEAILAMKLERKYSKDQILERYLNTIYFGRGAYGVETASKAYFGKDVQQLTLREAAYLGGLIRAPELADAYTSPDVATQRRDLTLGSMVRYASITPEQADEVKNQTLKSYVIPKSQQQPTVEQRDKGTEYFLAYVRSFLISRYGEERVLNGGLRVTTTLDLKSQAQAYDSIYGFLKPSEPAGALVNLDENGHIKAMVGGRDWSQSQVNYATGRAGGGGGRQPGSTFKPIALAAALEKGISIRDTFPGPNKLVVKGWDPSDPNKPVENFGNEAFGNIDLVEATVHSVNTVYAQLAVEVGANEMARMAKELGVTSDLKVVNGIALGAGEVSPLDMATVYLTFAQRGVHVAPSAVIDVKDADGNVIDRFSPKRTRVMSQRNADLVNYALQQVVQRGTGAAAQFGKPIAGKTGTTNDNGDAWFVGYTPNMSTAVWMGWPQGQSKPLRNIRGYGEVTGGTLPAQMWNHYMKLATENAPADKFVTPTIPPSNTTAPSSSVATTPLQSSTSSSVSPSSSSSSSTIPGNGTTSTTKLGTLEPGVRPVVSVPQTGGLQPLHPQQH